MTERRDELGELIDPTDESGVDQEKDLVADDERYVDPTGVDRAPQDAGEVVPAEEAAMHLTDEPPMDDGDRYLDE
jgi:hypothetical protein